MLYPAATSADSPLAHMVAHPLQLALVVLFHPPTGANTALALGQLALCGGGLCGGSCICGSGGIVHENNTDTLAICTVWWWSVVVVVVLCGSGGYIYIYIYIYHMHGSEYLCMLSCSQWQLASPEPVSS